MTARRSTRTVRSTRTSRRVVFDVFVTDIGEEPRVFEMSPGSTVGDCLSKAGYSRTTASTVRLDARACNLTTRVKQNQIISIVGNVEGGGGL